MNLIYYPNTHLTTPCAPVEHFDAFLRELLDEMKRVMVLHRGVGLSANQCSISQAVFIMKDAKGEVLEFVNPSVVGTDGTALLQEGCLSFPGIFLPIARPENVILEWQDALGEKKRAMFTGLDARCVLHEMDHIQGKLYLENVNRAQRKAAISKLKKSLR